MPRRRRRSIRLPGYDYRRPGWYFVTICTHERACLFGEGAGGAIRLGPAGQIVGAGIRALPRHFRRVVLDAFVVMPNHVHVVLGLVSGPAGSNHAGDETRRGEASVQSDPEGPGTDAGGVPPVVPGSADASPLLRPVGVPGRPGSDPVTDRPVPAGTTSGSLGAVVQNLKSVTTRRINRLRRTPGGRVWQRNYWERVIRSEAELARVRQYVLENPLRWQHDRLHP